MKIHSQIILTGVILLIIISLPYIVAAKSTGNTSQFGGFLLNPIDGNSYLAKMNEGYSGEWLFTLPFTPGHENGAFLFEFYLFLGHAARWMSIPILTMFHLARIVSTAIFFVALAYFLRNTIKLSDKKLFQAVMFACFGSGAGWLFFAFGVKTSDFWVAEAYPFLSAYSNPHFILGMAILLMLLTKLEAITRRDLVIVWALGLLLAIIMPFAVILAGVIIFGYEVWRWLENRKIHLRPIAVLLMGGGICGIFQYWQTLRDPLLANWNTQNITPTPPVWDLFIALSPALLLLAFIGIRNICKTRPISQGNKILLIWLFCTAILLIVPFSLQRRFMFGIYIPIAILAVEGICVISKDVEKKANFLFFVIFIFSLVTNILIIISGLSLVKSGHPLMVLDNNEMDTFLWIDNNTNENDIILSSPTLGNFLPAYTGRQVLYGHVFETVNADLMETGINNFYTNTFDLQEQEEFLIDNQVDWIIQGPRETMIGVPEILKYLEKVYQNESVTVYEVDRDS